MSVQTLICCLGEGCPACATVEVELHSTSDDDEGASIGKYQRRVDATKVVAEIAYQPEPFQPTSSMSTRAPASGSITSWPMTRSRLSPVRLCTARPAIAPATIIPSCWSFGFDRLCEFHVCISICRTGHSLARLERGNAARHRGQEV